MPSRNVSKVYLPDTFYHVYNRGWNFMKIFQDESDYTYFEYLLSRHLSDEPVKDNKGREYPHFREDIQLNAYCLMGNHFHLLLYQRDEMTLPKLMASVMTAYTSYFNHKYHQRGGLFESRYKAAPVLHDTQLMHITRYIHLNHSRYRAWKHSSYGDYVRAPREWLEPEPILELFTSPQAYIDFVADYEALQHERDEIKHLLADS